MATLTPEELAAQEADLKRRQQELEAQSAQFAEREAKLATQEKAAKRQASSNS
ncbi:hypothetical protein [Methylogaea oryzae]|uniref:hypothetical protein n=1 Tax=Methylogaea oryzae TaxID=1295382 RepID=UPI0012E24EC7|nr:hypothetical protein [Methylogaea oryzae]